jgi:hypothetical protein
MAVTVLTMAVSCPLVDQYFLVPYLPARKVRALVVRVRFQQRRCGGEQQSVATAQATREWARLPCRHFKNQSCFFPGSALEVAFQTRHQRPPSDAASRWMILLARRSQVRLIAPGRKHERKEGGRERTGEAGPEVRRDLQVHVGTHVEVENVAEVGVRHEDDGVLVYAPVVPAAHGSCAKQDDNLSSVGGAGAVVCLV